MANEATKLTIGGVQHDIMDAEARRLIALLQAALDAMTGTDTTTAIETFQEVLDFLAGVTDDETLVGKITALQTAINGKVDKETGKGLSTNDYTTAEKQKLAGLSNYNDSALQTAVNNLQTALANVYTKAQTDNAIQEAVEGLGGGSVESITINGQTKTPDSQGNVDLGTIQGAKGDKGEKGDTVVIDPEGLAQFEIANDLDTSDPTQGLSARQGKILKQAISTVQANLQAVVDALANMAFTSAKPTLSQIDWTGGTFYASVVYGTMTGCNHTDNTNSGQIAEGSTLNVTLSAQSGFTLTGATISVTNGNGQSVAYTLSNNVLSVANVIGTINISVIAVGVFSVSNTDTNVDLSAQTLQPLSGSSWSGTLSIKSSVTGYHLAPTPNVTMGGVAVDFSASGNSWNQSTGAMTIGSVTGDIVIVSASSEVVTHAVNQHLLNMTSSNNAAQVIDGQSFSTTITPDTGCTDNDVLRVYMDGQRLTANTDYTYNSSTGALSIPNVTGDIDIIASAATGTVTIETTEAATINMKLNGSTVATAITTADDGNGKFVATVQATSVGWNAQAYYNNVKLKSIDFGGAKTYGAMGKSFGLCSNLQVVKDLVINRPTDNTMIWAFRETKIAEHNSIFWDTENVTNWEACFYGNKMASIDVSYLVTAAATSLNQMFNVCNLLTSIDVSSWDVSGVTNIDRCFASCSRLGGTLDLSAWATTSALTSLGAFTNGTIITSVIIGDFDTSGVTANSGFWSNDTATIQCISQTPPAIGSFNWLSLLYNIASIIVPAGRGDAYKAASGWSDYANKIEEES